MHRVALVFTTSPLSEMEGSEPIHPSARAFVHRLRELGYREGENLLLERRTAEGRLDELPDIIFALVTMKTDVIVAVGHPSIIPALKLATTVPIILAASYFDPVEAGVVQSLARPGRNVTGLTITSSPEIEAKRLELLEALLPEGKRVAFLGMKPDWEDAYGRSVRAAAEKLGIGLTPAFHEPRDYSGAFDKIAREHSDAVVVANTPINFANRELIVQFATKNHLPSVYSRREYVEAGGLLSYGIDVTALMVRAGDFVDKILRGARPSDLPIEQPTKFELTINIKTAKALGLDVPLHLQQLADEVIE
jgi:putative ABC transport system substrate-binding protein